MDEEGQEMTDLRVGDASGFEISDQRKTYVPVLGTHCYPQSLSTSGEGFLEAGETDCSAVCIFALGRWRGGLHGVAVAFRLQGAFCVRDIC